MRICTSPAAGGGGSGTSISSSLRSATRVSARIQPCLSQSGAIVGSAVEAYRRGQPAVNRQVRAGDVGGGGCQQEGDDAGDVLGLGEALRRNLALHRLAVLAIFRKHLGIDEARRHVIDGDAAARALDCERARIAEQRSF